MRGDPKSWKKMKRYNLHDVKLLEQLYLEVSPWVKQPNGAMWGQVCINPACGSKRLQARGVARTKTRTYQRYQCTDCGVWSRAVGAEMAPRASRVGI
jgi:hypothetical protein